MKERFLLLSVLILILICNLANAQIFVNDNATGNNNGNSWPDAYNDLQDALAAAVDGDTIWVAEGIYKPDTIGGSDESTFLIDQNLKLYGGFVGTEDSLAERGDPANHPTILSGDLNSNDIVDDFVNFKEDNVMTVVTVASGLDNLPVVDGFIIQNGHADGTGDDLSPSQSGGGVHSQGSLQISHCTFKQNFADAVGGAVFQNGNSNKDIVIENCIFERNQSRFGGGIGLNDANYEITMSDFLYNSAQKGFGDAEGGGIYSLNGKGVITNCEFIENNCEYYGGGISVQVNEDAVETTAEIIGCTFQQNICYEYDGGGLSIWAGGQQPSFTVIGCEFIENQAMATGGLELGSYEHSHDSDLLVDSCSFFGNLGTTYGAAGMSVSLSGTNANCSIRNSEFKQNSAPTFFGGGAGMVGFNGNGSIEVTNCTFEENYALNSGGLDIGSLPDAGYFEYYITDCTFLGNMAIASSGGLDLYSEDASFFLVERCLFKDNTSNNLGAGLHVNTNRPDANIFVQNCIMENNNSPHGAGITAQPYLLFNAGNTQEGNVTIANCLVKENVSDNSAIRIKEMGNIQLLNCTIANNSGDGISQSAQSSLTLQNTILANPGYVEYTASANSTFASHGGNLIGDNSLDASGALLPSDQSGTAPNLDVNYFPTDGGNLVNAGVNDGVTAFFDLAGNDRIQNGFVDIGAYESGFTTSASDVIVGEIGLSPNPATDFLQLQLPESITQPTNISLFDAQDKLVEQRAFSAGQTLPVSHLPSGFYILKLIDGDQIYIGNFIKQ